MKYLCLDVGTTRTKAQVFDAKGDICFQRNEECPLKVIDGMPYADIDHLDDPKVKEITEAEGYSWGHTLEEQIQGQISAGFVITGFYEDRGCALLDKYINTSMATKAVKC